jgi:hypothetical protein
VRVQALAMAVRAATIAALGYRPVAVAVGRVAVLAESCIVVEPGGVDLGEAQRVRKAWVIRPARLASMGSP